MTARPNLALLAAVFGVSAGIAAAGIAQFDTLAEGNLGPTFTHGGIRFFDLDDRAGGFPVSFAIERAESTLSGPGFSPNNTLGFGSWDPSPAAAFSQCGSFWFTTDSVQTFASIDVFEWLSPPGNTIRLEAFRNGVMVNSDSGLIPDNRLINHWTLSVSGVEFDTLRLNGTGPNDRGIFIGLVDNVVVAPAPASALALASLAALPRRRRA